LQEDPDVNAVLASWRVEWRLQLWPVQVQGVIDHPFYRQHWPLLEQAPTAWQQVASGQGAMLSEQLARRLGVGTGDEIELPGEPPQRMQVVGIYADYGNPKGHVLVNADWLRQHAAAASLSGLSLLIRPGQVAKVRDSVQQRFGLDEAQLVEQASLKTWSTQIFSRTFAVTAALNSLTLGVAGVALFISQLTLGQQRLGQLAPLWALGVPRHWLAWLSLGQALMLCGFTVLLAIPLGLLLAWCLVAVVTVQAFGWRLPWHVFASQLAQLAALGVLSSLLASAWPLWQLARRQPGELMRRFADEG